MSRNGHGVTPVELIIVYDQSAEDGAARETTELIENEGAHLVIGASRTGPGLAMRPIAEQAQIATVSVAGTAPIVEESPAVSSAR